LVFTDENSQTSNENPSQKKQNCSQTRHATDLQMVSFESA